MAVLNAALFGRLRRLFEHVVVAKAGEPLIGSHYSVGDGRTRFHAITTGEYYRVSCPFCRHRAGSDDTRFRLHISHHWGVDDGTGDCFWWAAKCFNEDCLSSRYVLAELRSRVYGDLRSGVQASQVLPSKVEYADPGPCELPGDCMPIDRLGESHEATIFLRSRNFDPRYLYQKYGILFCVCALPQYAAATGMIVIPVYHQGKLVTWQCRYPGDADWRHTLKYFNCPNRPKRTFLYGSEHVQPQQPVALVEGPLDVWRMGDGAMGLFGKTISDQQIGILQRLNTIVPVMLDEDALATAKVVCSRLRWHKIWSPEVVLKHGSPARFTTEQCWGMVAEAIQQFIENPEFLAV